MAEFPDEIYTSRETENLPGIVYDPADKKNMFSEDFQNLGGEINAIEETLGINPQGIYATVKEWLEALAAGGSSVWGAITGTLSDQTDLQSALDAKQNSLGFTAENVANKSTDLTSPDNTKYPTTLAVQTAITNAVVGLLDYRGTYDASGNAFPSSSGSGSAGAILKGDFWMCSVAGTLGGTAVSPGDLIIALVDTPGSTAGNWDLVSHDINYVPENVANKENTTIDTSTTKYPTVNLLKTGLDTKQASLGYTPENVANKNTNVSLGTSDTDYPSQKAVKTYVDAHAGGGGLSLVSYQTASGASGITSGTIDLATDVRYKIIVTAKGGTTSKTFFLKINGVTTANSYWFASNGRRYDGSGSSNNIAGFKDSQASLNNTQVNAMHAQIEVSLLKDNSGNLRPVFYFNFVGYWADSGELISAEQGGAMQNTQSNITSININQGSGSSDWELWIYKYNTA